MTQEKIYERTVVQTDRTPDMGKTSEMGETSDIEPSDIEPSGIEPSGIKEPSGIEEPLDSRELSPVEEENLRLREENERLRRAEEERIRNLNPKERLYDKINVSLRTMNIIVGVLFVILAVVLVLGLLDR